VSFQQPFLSEMLKINCLGLLWLFMALASNVDCEMRLLWDLPWSIRGISMSLVFPNERLGESCYYTAMVEFLDFIF
jgi:hypothetical protein